MKKINAFNLQEVLIVLVIVGILLLLALPSLMPLIGKTWATEAKIQLRHINTTQTTYRMMYSKYTTDINDLDFQPPKTVKEGGDSNYVYEIIESSNNSFKAKATAITDFNGNGIFNVWEIDQDGKLKEVVKD